MKINLLCKNDVPGNGMGVKIYLLIATFPGTGVEQVYEQAFPVSGQGGLLWPQSSVRSGHIHN
jgi:hypothetical protein